MLKGNVACIADEEIVKGTVLLITDILKVNDVPENSILVTPMTDPRFVPIMTQVIGIITDAGGITSHAAIISRELSVPCIVGTQDATKELHNGDKIEMNLKTGEIRKL